MIIKVPIEISQTGTGLQATVQGLQQVESAARKTRGETESLGKQFAQGLGIGSGMVAFGMAKDALFGISKAALQAARDAAAYAEKVRLVQQQTGWSATSVQQYEKLLKSMGMSFETVTQAMGRAQKAIAAGDADLKKLGLTTQGLMKLSPEKQFEALAKSIMAIDNPAQRTAAAMSVFGKSGAALIPVLAQVAAGAEKTFSALSGSQLDALADLDDMLDRAEQGWEDFKNAMVAAVLDNGGSQALRYIAEAVNGLFAALNNPGWLNTAMGIWMLGLRTMLEQLAGGMATLALKAEFLMKGQFANAWKASVAVSLAGGAGSASGAGSTLGGGGGSFSGGPPARAPRTSAATARAELEAQQFAYWANSRTDEDFAMGLPAARTGGAFSTLLPGAAGQHYSIQDVGPAARAAAKSQAEAARSAEQWQAALTGVALLAGAVGGNLGATLQVVGNIGESFRGWKTMTPTGKFNTVASGVGQIGGMIGGKGGGALQGAAGGAMMGATIGSILPGIGTVIGGVVGGVIGGVAGFISGGKKEKERKAEEEAARQAIRDDVGGSFGQLASQTTYASRGFLEILDAARGTKEATEWISQNLEKAASGVQRMAAGMKHLSASGAAAVGSAVFSTIEKAVALQGIGAAGQYAGAYQTTIDDLAGRGIDTSAMGGDRAARVMALSGNEAVTGLSGVARGMGDAVQGLLNAGAIDTNYLRDTSTAAVATVDELRNQGLTNREVYTEMASYLNAAIASYSTLGQQVPEEIAKMVAESEAAGVMIVGDQGIGKTNRLLEQILQALGHSYSGAGTGGYGAPEAPPYDAGFDSGDYGGSRRPDYGAARGFKPRLLNRDTVFLAHRGERVGIFPPHVAMVSAARGFYEDDLVRDDRGGGFVAPDAPASSSTTFDTTTASASVVASASAAAVQQVLAPIVETIARIAEAPSISVPMTYAPQVTIRDESVVQTPEAVRAFNNLVVGSLQAGLEQNARGVRASVKGVITETLRENGLI